MTDDIATRVRAMLCEHLGVEPSRIADDATSLRNDIGADSLDCMEVCMVAEDEFEIEIPDDAMRQVDTVGDVIRLVREALDVEGEAA